MLAEVDPNPSGLTSVDPLSGSSSSSDDDANTCYEDLSTSSFSAVPSVESLAGSLSFLVVEDSPTQRKLIVRGLQQVSPLWSVEACADSKSALALLRSHKAFDVILVDLNLGEGSLMGDKLVREIRAGPGCNLHAPVIIGLNRSRTDTEVRFIVSGADSAWAKPLPPNELISQRVEVLVAARKLMCELVDAPIDTFTLTPTDQCLNALRAASVGTVDRSF
jgi:CheY-like chemotaxis protein